MALWPVTIVMFLKDKVALINYVASQFGLCFVLEFLKIELKGIAITGIDATKGQELISSISKEYGMNKAIFIKAKRGNKSDMEDALNKTVDVFGSVDIVINVTESFDEPNYKNNRKATSTPSVPNEFIAKYTPSKELIVISILPIYSLTFCQNRMIYDIAKQGKVTHTTVVSIPSHHETGVKMLAIYLGQSSTTVCFDIARKVLAPERYGDVMQKLGNLQYQKADSIARALTRIAENFENGEAWLIENHECYQIEVSQELVVRKLRKLCL